MNRKAQVLALSALIAMESLAASAAVAQISSSKTSGNRAKPASADSGGTEVRESVLSIVKSSQDRLRRGEFVPYTIVSGSIASYDEAKISPKDAFLNANFNEVVKFEVKDANNPLWRQYTAIYAPKGLGNPYWDVEFVIGVGETLRKVQMVYRPPSPF